MNKITCSKKEKTAALFLFLADILIMLAVWLGQNYVQVEFDQSLRQCGYAGRFFFLAFILCGSLALPVADRQIQFVFYKKAHFALLNCAVHTFSAHLWYDGSCFFVYESGIQGIGFDSESIYKAREFYTALSRTEEEPDIHFSGIYGKHVCRSFGGRNDHGLLYSRTCRVSRKQHKFFP